MPLTPPQFELTAPNGNVLCKLPTEKGSYEVLDGTYHCCFSTTETTVSLRYTLRGEAPCEVHGIDPSCYSYFMLALEGRLMPQNTDEPKPAGDAFCLSDMFSWLLPGNCLARH